MKADLDSKENIARFIELFYQKVLSDEILTPIFVDIAEIKIEEHLGHICAYWEKLLLGGSAYNRHTMEIHRALNAKSPLTPQQFERWLGLFFETAEANFEGEQTERAKRIASNIAGNMEDRFYHKMDQPNRRQL
jgi:hemoglobin